MEQQVILITLIVVVFVLFSIYFTEKMFFVDKCFVVFCLIAHVLLFVSFFVWTKPLQYIVDWMLFVSMGCSIFLRSTSLLILSICTMIVLGVYHSTFGICVLTGEKWDSNTSRIFYVLLAIQVFKILSMYRVGKLKIVLMKLYLRIFPSSAQP